MDITKNNHKFKAGILMDSNKKPYRERIYNGKKRKIFLTHYDGVTRTKSDFAEDCDVNRIMANYRQGGPLPNLLQKDGIYGDFSNLPNYQNSLDTVNQAKTEFNSLNSKTRNRFDNNPAKLIAFLQDKDNKDEAISLGLIEKSVFLPPEAPEPQGGPGAPAPETPAVADAGSGSNKDTTTKP